MGNKEFFKIVDQLGNERIRVRVSTQKGKVTDVMVQSETRIGEQWHEVVRYDCSHGFLHRDVIHPNKTVEKTPLHIQNLNDALQYAEQDILDRWSWYKEKYKRRLKHDKT
jgi:hypothetical protein